MRDIYLSIDLDYWAKFNSTTDADSFFDQVFNLKLPCHIVASHEQLLPYIKTSKCRHVYNVDYHSDLADFGSRPNEGKVSLCDGNWVNYVNFRRKGGEYVWFAPSKDNFKVDNGYCHLWKNPFLCPSVRSDWKKARKEIGWKNVPWHRIKAVGITLSIALNEYMSNWLVVSPVLNVLKRLNLVSNPLMRKLNKKYNLSNALANEVKLNLFRKYLPVSGTHLALSARKRHPL